MKPLRVALIHRDSPRSTDKRMVGIWSYPVPEFTWDHYPISRAQKLVPGGFQLDRADFAGEYDLIFYEDGKLHGRFTGAADIPIAYYVVDSTLTQDHYKIRRQQAAQCDLVLVDHDELQRFRWRDGPIVRRLSHCVNDTWFRDYGLEKSIDVSFHCRVKGSPQRAELEAWLAEFCAQEGYSYANGTRYDEEYAQAFNRSKVTVNLARTPTNRPHRVFDALACRVCLVSSVLPAVDPIEIVPGVHYEEYRDRKGLAALLHGLLAGIWGYFAVQGYEHVQKYHTWAARAKELRLILREELGI